MRKNIRKVLDAFSRGEPAKGDSKETCSTDGTTVYSYRTKIAERLPNGLIWVTTRSHSRTTNAQVSAVRSVFGDWDGESWTYSKLIETASLDDFCGHGADLPPEEVTRDHCWGNPELMRACLASGAGRG